MKFEKFDLFLKKASLFINLLLFIILFILKDILFSLITSSGESVFLFNPVFFRKLFISLSFLSSSFKSLFLPKFKLFKTSFSFNIFCSYISFISGLKNEYILEKCVFNSDHSDKFIQAFDNIISSSIIFWVFFMSSILFVLLLTLEPYKSIVLFSAIVLPSENKVSQSHKPLRQIVLSFFKVS